MSARMITLAPTLAALSLAAVPAAYAQTDNPTALRQEAAREQLIEARERLRDVRLDPPEAGALEEAREELWDAREDAHIVGEFNPMEEQREQRAAEREAEAEIRRDRLEQDDDLGAEILVVQDEDLFEEDDAAGDENLDPGNEAGDQDVAAGDADEDAVVPDADNSLLESESYVDVDEVFGDDIDGTGGNEIDEASVPNEVDANTDAASEDVHIEVDPEELPE